LIQEFYLLPLLRNASVRVHLSTDNLYRRLSSIETIAERTHAPAPIALALAIRKGLIAAEITRPRVLFVVSGTKKRNSARTSQSRRDGYFLLNFLMSLERYATLLRLQMRARESRSEMQRAEIIALNSALSVFPASSNRSCEKRGW
jgi:hypothetical protein